MKNALAGVVLRSENRQNTALFYEAFGMVVKEHAHGGPQHFEVGPLISEFVVEIYQSSEKFSRDAVMIEVASLEKALQIGAKYGSQAFTEIKETSSLRFVYIKDPDGRDVMLIEKVQDLSQKRCIPYRKGTRSLSEKAINEKLLSVKGWKRTENSIFKSFVFERFSEVPKFFTEVAKIAEREDHHPDMILCSGNEVTIFLTTHTTEGLTENDFIVASIIDDIV